MSAPGGDALVTDNPVLNRFELSLSGSVAFIDYQRTGTRYVLTHAEVPATLRGRGIGARLTAAALQLVRAQGGSVVARCPYVAQFIAHNAQYQDLLAPS